MSGIYVITNIADSCGTVYVGSTTQTFNLRWNAHTSLLRRGKHHNPHFQAAWNMYGEAAFKFSIIEESNDFLEIIEHEQVWLDFYRMYIPVYNLVMQIDMPPMLGRKFSPEHRHNISKANKGRTKPPLSAEHRQKLSQANIGQVRSEGTRCRISAVRAGRYPAFHNRETGETISAGHDLTAMCKKHNLWPSAMCCVMHGKRKHHRGWEL